MRMMIAAALAVLATPAIAQTTPANVDPASTAPPATSTDPAGGYAPAGSPVSGDPSAPTKTYVQAPDPTTAFPPPPPQASYPVCKKGQTDGCIDPGSAKSTVYRK